MSGCAGVGSLKIGERLRPNTFTVKPPHPTPCSHEEYWKSKSQFPEIEWKTAETIVADANSTAQAWLKHPANAMQLPSLQKAHDEDGDGLIDANEFKSLLTAAGAGTGVNASILFDQMDSDGDGVLTEEEIKALGQDASARRSSLTAA